MKLSIGAVVLVTALVTPLAGAAQDPELSANIGFVSEYLFRGIPQTGTSGSAGLDFAVSKIYLGTWAADVGAGNEIDLYAGFGTDVGDFNVGIGGTGYFYTSDDFDRPYLEGNLNAGYKALSAEFNYGRHSLEQVVPADPDSENYWFAAATVEQWGLYAKVGVWGDDASGANFDGEYYEAGYSVSVGGLDLSASWVYGTDKLMETIAGLSPPSDDHAEHTLIFGIGHTFDIDLN